MQHSSTIGQEHNYAVGTSVISKSKAVTSSEFENSSTTSLVKPNAAPKYKKLPEISQEKLNYLLSLGAENTTGPWLCLRCGHNGDGIILQTYAAFRLHLTKVHGEVIDPALCLLCGKRSSDGHDQRSHMKTIHKFPSQLFELPNCKPCHELLSNAFAFKQHFNQAHPDLLTLLHEYLIDFQHLKPTEHDAIEEEVNF